MVAQQKHATAENFVTWERKAKAMTDAGLEWSMKDCRETAAIQPWNECYYLDEFATYSMELRKRQAKRAKRNRHAIV